MPAVEITIADLEPFAVIEPAKAYALIDGALARAARVAPCILDATLSDTNAAAAKGIIVDAILRRNDAGSGAVSQSQQTTGPFSHSQSVDTRQPARVLFWPSEVSELQAICTEHGGAAPSGAFAVDTVVLVDTIHALWCSLYFGATYCSCGADLAGYPIYGPGTADP